MAKSAEMIETIKLASLEGGVITVAHMEKPYGESSDPVVSIAVSLHSESREPDWQVHIPYPNINAVIKALQKTQAQYEKNDTGYHLHDELASDTGGGGA